MKLVFVLLACFVAVTLQQNVYWRSRADRGGLPPPNYFGIEDYFHQYPAGFRPYLEIDEFPNYFRSQAENGLNAVIDPETGYLAARQGIFSRFRLRRTTTTTIFSFSTSTITVPTVVTCFKSSMFATQTPCRRKRSLLDMILHEDEDNEDPSQNEASDRVNDQLPREGRDMDAADLIASSQEETVSGVSHLNPSDAVVNEYIRKERQLFGGRTSTVTSVIPSYVLSYSTSTITNSKLARAAALSCLPPGYTAC